MREPQETGFPVALIIVSLLLLITSNCMPSGAHGSPDIRGEITSINHATAPSAASSIFGSILVEGTKEADTKVDRASVTVRDKTRIYRQEGQNRRQVSFDALAVGQRVEVWFTGPVAQSYPVQATADHILLLSDTSSP